MDIINKFLLGLGVGEAEAEGCQNKIQPLACDVLCDIDNETNWYLIVFVPYDKNYDPNFNANDWIRKNYTKGSNYYLITRESASKVHWNLLVNSDEPVERFHLKATQKFKLFVQKVNYGTHPRVYKYITKDYYEKGLPWELYKDFSFKI